MARNRMPQAIAPASMGSPGVEGTPVTAAAIRDGDDSQAIALFDRAVADAMYEGEFKAEEVAAMLGVSYQHLSDFRTGKRTIAFHRIIRLVSKDQAAARAIVGALCEMAGFEPPRRRRKLDKGDVKRQLELELRKSPQLVELFLQNVARAFGADVDEVRDAWSEPTGEHRIADLVR